jgi:hypothetical protein
VSYALVMHRLCTIRFQADAKIGYSNFKVKDEGKEKDVVKRKDK